MSYEYQEHRRILLIDENARKLNVRANVLRNHEIEVHTCSAIAEAMPLWRNIPYDLVLMALANDGRTEELTRQIRDCKPAQRIGLLVGPPTFIREIARPARPHKQTNENVVPIQTVSAESNPEPQWQWSVSRVIKGWYSDYALGSEEAPFPISQRTGTEN